MWDEMKLVIDRSDDLIDQFPVEKMLMSKIKPKATLAIKIAKLTRDESKKHQVRNRSHCPFSYNI